MSIFSSIKKHLGVGEQQQNTRFVEQTKVYIPIYSGGEFQSLKEVVEAVQGLPGGLRVYIADIVLYNIRFRDCLRAQGIEGVIRMLIDEAPAISEDTEALDELRWRWTERLDKRIADYDIQCLLKDSRMCIDGCWFDGLDDVKQQVEMAGNPRHTYSRWSAYEKHKPNPSGLHIGNLWESYPTFDSYDVCDGRSFDNYVFAKQPLTEEMMEDYSKRIRAPFNFCMVHENIPDDLLPVLYYEGEGDTVLLATSSDFKH